MKVVLDSSVIIRMFHQSEDPVEVDRRKCARAVCSSPQLHRYIPTLVIAEVLAGLDEPEGWKDALAAINSMGTVVGMDVDTALVAARRRSHRKGSPGDLSRHCRKADTLIMAHAVAVGAQQIFTYNPKHFESAKTELRCDVVVASPFDLMPDLLREMTGQKRTT